MNVKAALIILGFYCGSFGCAYCTEMLTLKAGEKIVEIANKRQLKKEEQRDLRKKAEANGWTIVECEYTIEAV